MVEMMIRKAFIFTALLFCSELLSAQEVKPRIEALAADSAYMALLQADMQLKAQEDALAAQLDEARRALTDKGDVSESSRNGILQLERRFLDVSLLRTSYAGRIADIEQQWVLDNFEAEAKPVEVRRVVEESAVPVIPESEKRRNLVYNGYFAEKLSGDDYRALLRSQELELVAAAAAAEYRKNHADIVELKSAYAAEKDEKEAAAIYDRYKSLRHRNLQIADSLSATWSYIFDNKNYAYSYLLDVFDQDMVLVRTEDSLLEASHRIAAMNGRLASSELTDYYLRKRVVMDYELSVAEVLKLDAARDSLRNAAMQFSGVDYYLPKVEIVERNFLQYDTVAFSSTPRYTAKKPIPKCRVYSRGTIYRVLLGTFAAKRPVSTFRGTYPISYFVDKKGKWNYVAGGYATKVEADRDKRKLQERGFLHPEVVVWRDGKFHNVDAESEGQTATFRVEISGIEALTEEMKDVVATLAREGDLSRVGSGHFFIGPIANRAEADDLAAALRHLDSELMVKVTQVAE